MCCAGLMAVWRTFYASFLDIWSFRSAAGSRLDRERDINQFADALRAAILLSLACCAILQVGGRVSGWAGPRCWGGAGRCRVLGSKELDPASARHSVSTYPVLVCLAHFITHQHVA
jgi:hypothetical protein